MSFDQGLALIVFKRRKRETKASFGSELFGKRFERIYSVNSVRKRIEKSKLKDKANKRNGEIRTRNLKVDLKRTRILR